MRRFRYTTALKMSKEVFLKGEVGFAFVAVKESLRILSDTLSTAKGNELMHSQIVCRREIFMACFANEAFATRSRVWVIRRLKVANGGTVTGVDVVLQGFIVGKRYCATIAAMG